MTQQQLFPPLPERLRPEILKRLNVIELMIIAERFGAKAVIARMGMTFEDALQQAASRGQK